MELSDLDWPYIHKTLGQCSIGHTIDFHTTIPSTMPQARRLAEMSTTRTGTIVLAEKQTAGRGRFARRWEMPYGQGLSLSIILKAPHLLAQMEQLPMLTGVAIAHAIASVAPQLAECVWLKWPNDLLLATPSINETVDRSTPSSSHSDNAHRAIGKVAGILIESVYRQNEAVSAILGIGINANQHPDALPPVEATAAFPPTSMCICLGRSVDRTKLLVALCHAIENLLQTPTDIYPEWRSRLYTLGQWITVKQQHTHDHTVLAGRAVDVTQEGALIVETADGTRHLFTTGDVTLRGASGGFHRGLVMFL